MTRAFVAWWWRRTSGPDRLVLLAGTTVRLAAIVMLAAAIPLAWRHFPHPGWSLLLGLLVAAENALVVSQWLTTRRIGGETLAVDLPFGVAALLANAALATRQGPGGWTGFVFPHTVMIALTLGLACRRPALAVLAGLTWALADLLGSALIGHLPLVASLYVLPAYLINPIVGTTCARLLRRATEELDAARIAAVHEVAEVATEQERVRYAHALHDRILQTLETLARGGVTAGPLRDRVQDEAAWLRRFVETGVADDSDDLASALAAAARTVARSGTRVELNDAGLRSGVLPDLLDGPAREALVESTHHLLSALGRPPGGIVVRASWERGGVLVTVLSTTPSGPLDQDEIDSVEARLVGAGGEFRLEPLPYAELWMPGARS